MRGPKLLKQYLLDTKQRPVDLARSGGFDESQLSRWLRGERRPSLDSAERLENHTGVPAGAWSNVEIVEPKPRRAAAHHSS